MWWDPSGSQFQALQGPCGLCYVWAAVQVTLCCFKVFVFSYVKCCLTHGPA